MIVKSAIAGMKAFDVNEQLFPNEAKSFRDAGYEVCIRYLPRTSELISGNLTAVEMATILDAGLALSAVQHCPLPNWQPNGFMGAKYGQFAGHYAEQIGLPKGMNIWLDLEMVAVDSKADDIISYCENWYDQVGLFAYVPGIYIGYQTGLTDEQLYQNLSFQHYWRAYNCDQSIPKRGWQMLQHPQKTLGGINYDPDIVQVDNLGDLPTFIFPS